MSEIVECEKCSMMTAHLECSTEAKVVSFISETGWTSEYFLEYACANCSAEFSTIVPCDEEKTLDAYESMEAYFGRGGVGSRNIYHLSGASRTIGFNLSRSTPNRNFEDYVTRNRRRVTAHKEDITSKSTTTRHSKNCTLTQINLEIEEDV